MRLYIVRREAARAQRRAKAVRTEWGPVYSRRPKAPTPYLDRAKQVQAMLNQKMDIIDIAEAFGITKNAVNIIINQYGLVYPK